MRRWQEDFRIARREWLKHRRMHIESNKDRRQGYGKYDRKPGLDPYIVDCECDEQIGRFRKKDAWDCGNTQCGICHSDKFPKRSKTNQELKSDLDFEEQLAELDGEQVQIAGSPNHHCKFVPYARRKCA